MPDQLDTGDKLACGLGYKHGLPSFSSLDFHVSVSISKREGETDEEFSLRGWAAAEAELTKQVEAKQELLDVIRPIIGSPDDWN